MKQEGKGIKTREINHDVKALDKAAVAAEKMRRAAARTKEQCKNLMDDGQITPEEYAGDMVRDVADNAVAGTKRKAKELFRTTRKAKERFRHQREKNQIDNQKYRGRQAEITGADRKDDGMGDRSSGGMYGNNSQAPAGRRLTEAEKDKNDFEKRKYGVRQHEARIHSANKKKINETELPSRRGIKETARSTGIVRTKNGTVKTANRNVKTAEKTSQVVIKTTKEAKVAAKKVAKSAARRAKRAAVVRKQSAIVAARAAKAAAKAVVTAVKACILAVKKLAAAIAAGGWVAVVIILIVCIIGLIVGSVFGIFFSSEDTGSGITMQEAVRRINNEYQARIESERSLYEYDDIEMSGSSAVWREVLSTYAVMVVNDPYNPQDVASLDEEKVQKLKDIFWEMNDITSRTETRTVTVIVETDDGDGNIVETEIEETRTTLYITVTHISANGMAMRYDFTDEQMAQLAELLDEDNRDMWAAVLYGIHSAGDTDIVLVALSQIGNVGGEPYWSWYGFDSRVDWCACFVSWCANECGYIDAGIVPKFAGCTHGAQWFKDRNQWADGSEEPIPGMIIFFDWDDPDGEVGAQDGAADHTGIVERVENGVVYTVEGNSGDSCRENHYPVGYYEILGYGVPAY